MTGHPHTNGRTLQSPILADAQFAGRLGGNQEFIATSDDDSVLEKQPDAVSSVCTECLLPKTDIFQRRRCSPYQLLSISKVLEMAISGEWLS